MDFIGHLGYIFLVRPLFNALILIYEVVPPHDLGIAIIILTLIVRFALYPLSWHALHSQRKLAALQPKIKELQEKHKGNSQAHGQALMALYKEHNTSPFSGFLTLLIQFPILLAMYRVFLSGIGPDALHNLYPFVSAPQHINPFFLGLVNLSVASPLLAIGAGIAQFLQAKTMFTQTASPPVKDKKGSSDMQNMMGKQMTYMTYIMPPFIVLISWRLPAALSLYWIVTMLFSFVQQYSMNKKSTESGWTTGGTEKLFSGPPLR